MCTQLGGVILLHLNTQGIFVFNPDDWSELRKKHRIIGELVGSSNQIPGLPLKLHPEEVILLLESKLAKVVKLINNTEDKSSEDCTNFTRSLLEKEKIIYTNIRRQQLASLKDTIILAKRKKGDTREEKEILDEELEKSCQVTEQNMIWPILNEPISLDMSCYEQVTVGDILKETTHLRCGVFKDLWSRGYYITSGHKFGGDYLVYLGDPIAYHAIFIVRCIEDNESLINASEIVAFGRLGTSVKKRAVLASFDDNKQISYITIKWIDS